MTIEEYKELPECENKEEFRKFLIQDLNNQLKRLNNGVDFKIIDHCLGAVTEKENNRIKRLNMVYKKLEIIYDLRNLDK